MLGPYAIYFWLAVLIFTNGLNWYLTAEYKDNQWGMATANQQIKAAGLLADEVSKVVKRERIAQIRVRELELEHNATTDTLKALERTNRTLLAKYGGLRDTRRRTGGANTVPAVTTQTDGTTNPAICDAGVLSTELTEELIAKAALADQLTEYAWQGYQWSIELEHATKAEVK